jgi:hypothetical protein
MFSANFTKLKNVYDSATNTATEKFSEQKSKDFFCSYLMGLNSFASLHNPSRTVKFSAHGIIFEREKITRYSKRESLHLGWTKPTPPIISINIRRQRVNSVI